MNLKKTTPRSTLTITRVDQARLLADPIKLRIIQEIAETAHTTKQVADILGEKPTKLYRHVEALRDAGLIKLVAEKQKRGTIEKYFLAVARRFEIHPDLFAPPSAEGSALLDELLGNSYSEMRTAIENIRVNPAQDEELGPCFSKLSVRATEDDIKVLRQQLLDWVKNCEERSSHMNTDEDLRWSGFIAFYPAVD